MSTTCTAGSDNWLPAQVCEALCKALLGCVHQIMDLKLPQIYAECLLPHVSSCLLPEALHRSMLRDANLHGSCPKPPPSNMTLAKLLRVPLGFAALGTLLVLLEYPYKAKIENGCPKRSRCPAPANQSARARAAPCVAATMLPPPPETGANDSKGPTKSGRAQTDRNGMTAPSCLETGKP